MSKKEIICYGVANCKLRRNLSLYLSDDFEVIGFCDSFFTEDILQGKRFFRIDELKEIKFDYIIVMTERDTVQKEIKQNLLKLGISEKKIVFPIYLYQENILYSPDLYRWNIKKLNSIQVEALICGLSYSLVGINEKNLKKSFFDLSWHGLDLYYNYQFFLQAKQYSNIKEILMVFPYYYFNYDMSRSLYQFSTGQIFACRGLKDWHNAINCNDVNINNYIINENLFGEKIWKSVKWNKYCRDTVKEISEDECRLNDIWKKKYSDTICENIKIFEEFLYALKQMDVKTSLIVPPFYVKCISKSDKIYLDEQKREFFLALGKVREKYNFEIFDYFDVYENKRHLFYDCEHLNESGKKEFTKLINEKVLN